MTHVLFSWFKTHSCPHPKQEEQHVMEACIPFLSTYLPTEPKQCALPGWKGRSTPGHPFKLTGSRSQSFIFSSCIQLASVADWHLHGQPPGHQALAYPHSGLALVCWMLTKRGRRWQIAHLLDGYPSASGHKNVLVWWDWFKTLERDLGKETESAERERYRWRQTCSADPLSASLPPVIFAISQQGSCSSTPKRLFQASLFPTI